VSDEVVAAPPAIELTSIVRIPLAPIAAAANGGPTGPCPGCGNTSFRVHQWDWKSVRDPQINRASVGRYQCKRCGTVVRRYPPGMDASTQSLGLKQLSVLLYCLGLSYEGVRAILSDLGCRLSTTTIRRNVLAGGHEAALRLGVRRLRLIPDGDARLRAPDGSVTVRVASSPTGERWLELRTTPGCDGELQWRLQTCCTGLGVSWQRSA
jgi:hypothetical protein